MTQEETDNILQELLFELGTNSETLARDLVAKAAGDLGWTREQVHAKLRETDAGAVLDQRLSCDVRIDAEPGKGFKRKPTT